MTIPSLLAASTIALGAITPHGCTVGAFSNSFPLSSKLFPLTPRTHHKNEADHRRIILHQTKEEIVANEKSSSKPLWMKCINGVVPPKVRALNEAVSSVANCTREEANELIAMGAVWARMETLTEEDVMDQYYEINPSSAQMKYADMPTGWGAGQYDDIREGGETLEEYVARQESLRYRRILTASTVEPGTDIRVYPHPRRFPSCYEFSDPKRKLYEDTTFVVVDKPPMLPTQPEPSNYEECCPGCVNLLMGPFHTITGEEVARPLICHRVDSCVGGCVVLSKDGNGQRVFSDLQRQRKIKKLYLAVTTEPVPLGMHVHWMWASLNARGQMGGTPCQFVSHTPPASRKKAKVSHTRNKKSILPHYSKLEHRRLGYGVFWRLLDAIRSPSHKTMNKATTQAGNSITSPQYDL